MIDIKNIDIKQYQERKIVIADTTFQINKLNAFESMKLLDTIRVSIASVNIDDNTNDITAIFKTIFGFPTEKLLEVQEKLFNKIQYTCKGDTGLLFLNSEHAINHAFKDGEPIDIYELLLRALAVNFTNSFKKIADKIQNLLVQNGTQKQQN